MDAHLQQLSDEHEVKRLVIRFSLGMDLRDYDLCRSTFADVVDVDIPALAGDAVALSGKLRADEYVKGVVALLSEFKATQHCSINHDVVVEGDLATMACYTLATHHMPVEDGDQWLTIGARYDIQARRFPVGWRMVKFKWTRLWASGNNIMWQEAARKLKAR